MVGRMVEVAPVADETDERLSLDAYIETWPHESFGLPEVRAFKASLLNHADLLARQDGVVLGSGFAALFPGLPDSPRVMVTVPPRHRGRGAGTALYSALSDWARERGLETLEAVLADNDPDSLAFAERRGFVKERHERGVALDVTAVEPPPVAPPPGVEIITWADRPELARGLFEVSLDASPDVPGYEDEEHEPFEAWLAHEMQGPGDRPEATFVAVAGDEAVGYAKFSLSSTAPTRAYHDLTAVKRAWRGRGIARALKSAQIGWAKANGFELLKTTNDERNTPMRRLNEQLGYRPWIGRLFLRGPLA
jgi:GNAT superfamily N-acetyltransferase